MQFSLKRLVWKTCMSHGGRKIVLFWSNSRNAFIGVLHSFFFFFEKLYQGSTTTKVEKNKTYFEKEMKRE